MNLMIYAETLLNLIRDMQLLEIALSVRSLDAQHVGVIISITRCDFLDMLILHPNLRNFSTGYWFPSSRACLHDVLTYENFMGDCV